ncbi:MAG: flagellar motor switch protein FliG, partial [Thiobacillus sp.]|nr:flagellar motor switch protein FliG [Thiobacillus sp.]
SLLERMSGGAAAAALAQLDSADAALAARLRARALEFDDLARAGEADRRLFLRHVSARTLLLALKGSDGRALAALAAAMSPSAALRMKDDLDTLGAVPVAEIQAAQSEAASLLRRLVAEGAIRFDGEARA